MSKLRLVILTLGLLATCLGTAVPADDHTLRYAGATTLQRYFMSDLAKAFYGDTAKRLLIEGGNTNPGIRALLNGEIDLAGSGRFLTEAEKQQGLEEHFLGWDVLAIVVHRSNPVSSLTMTQLQSLFSGETTNWDQVGGNTAPPLIISSPKGSGMRSAVEKMILKGKPMSRQEIIAAIVAKTDQQVALFPNSITALSRSMVDAETTKIIAVNDVAPTKENVSSGKYLLAKPLLLITRGKPEGALKQLVDLALSPRGKAILSKHFVPKD